MNLQSCGTCGRLWSDTDNTGVCPHGHEPEPDEPDFLTGEIPAIDVLTRPDGGVVGLMAAADQATTAVDLATRQAQTLREIRDLVECYSYSDVSRRVASILDQAGL